MHLKRSHYSAGLAVLAASLAGSAAAHEAWLLTPAEIEALAAEPIPALFTSRLWLILAALAGAAAVAFALRLEEWVRPLETELFQPIAARALAIGPLVLRVGLGLMLGLAATGGLPRHGTALWAEPTFLVPDMQLALVPGMGWLAPLQIVLAILFVIGLGARLVGLALIGLSLLGFALFGPSFTAYAPHFAAPGIILVLTGAGALSLDRVLGFDAVLRPAPWLVQPGWRLAQILIGAGFIYLAVAYKLTQPTLIMAILQHGNVPMFGLPLAVVALIMTGVEIVCGALVALGRLIRPVALVMLGAITFLAVTLGETPLFHANLYGVLAFFAMAGRTLSLPAAEPLGARTIAA